ncbi:MAG: dUTPase [Thermoproteota archaeon]|jgi:dimeric dUTPase (all-alpha-NTP-PPase superfamily)|nr:dUTPase [Thermoproteota archaeon]MRN60610.1 dUTPase [Nitrosopumilales archaeon]
MDALEIIFKLQKELAQITTSTRYPPVKEERISLLATAMVHEAIELQRLTNWKWWKKPTKFDQTRAREEVIDLWHFLVQTSIELGMTPNEILDEYLKKNQINKERQEKGY